MDATTAVIIFVVIIAITAVIYTFYFAKSYVVDPVTGNFLSRKEYNRLEAKRKDNDLRQRFVDECYQIDACFGRISDVCPDFRERLGKTRDIIYHTSRLKMLINAYEDLPDKDELIEYQDRFYAKVYEKVYKDLAPLVELYLSGERETADKDISYKALRAELAKISEHIEAIRNLATSLHIIKIGA